jgi:DNA polymerase (family 10)
VNEYGVFRGDEQIAGRTEADVYATLGLPWIPPELRENRLEFAWADAGRIPELVTVADIRGDLHMHTTASDGAATIEEMALAARARGLKYIAITDHSKRVSMANGLDATAPAAVTGKTFAAFVVRCTESKSFVASSAIFLKMPKWIFQMTVLEEADWVIAVLHYGLRQPREQIMKRLLNAIRNPTRGHHRPLHRSHDRSSRRSGRELQRTSASGRRSPGDA